MVVTVRTLRGLLADLPDDLLVVTSADDEGNAFRTLYDDCCVPGLWDPEERDFTSWGEDDEGNEAEVALEDANAVCIW
jgi:hypothetical protein